MKSAINWDWPGHLVGFTPLLTTVFWHNGVCEDKPAVLLRRYISVCLLRFDCMELFAILQCLQSTWRNLKLRSLPLMTYSFEQDWTLAIITCFSLLNNSSHAQCSFTYSPCQKCERQQVQGEGGGLDFHHQGHDLLHHRALLGRQTEPEWNF